MRRQGLRAGRSWPCSSHRSCCMRNVIFDVGGVLLDWNPDQLLRGYYAEPVERAAMRQAIFLHADWLEVDRGALSEEELLARIARRLGRPVPELAGLFGTDRKSTRLKSSHPIISYA